MLFYVWYGFLGKVIRFSVCVCVCVCACACMRACVREREREREIAGAVLPVLLQGPLLSFSVCH